MPTKLSSCALSAIAALAISGCSSPFDSDRSFTRTKPSDISPDHPSAFRVNDNQIPPSFEDDLANEPSEYIRYALYHSPEIERAYQRWRASTERLPQLRSLPDPRLNMGFFLNEVETRVGPQQARVGLQQTFPWIGKLRVREDAAARGALAAWFKFQETQLAITERVMIALHDLAYLDQATSITQDSYALLVSFEEIVRARYRLGSNSHPELIRIQVELGLLQDRITQLQALRAPRVAALNATLNRPSNTPVPVIDNLQALLATDNAEHIATLAQDSNPHLQAIDQQIEQARTQTELARLDGYPDFTVGVDYIITDEASGPTITESGDDPIMLSVGINLPIWRDKYNAGIRESIANRLSISRQRESVSNTIAAQVYQSWFDHTDAARRAELYQHSLIPKAKESLASSLAGFRNGDSEFLDLLDTQRTLLEFAITAQRARSDSGKALATLSRLAGHPVQVNAINTQSNEATP